MLQVMDDLRSADVDFLTIGQYLQPTRKHHRGDALRAAGRVQGATRPIAYAKGFLMVSASPLTRSSHHAGEDFARLKAARAAPDPKADAAILHETPRAPHAPPNMFDLVADVENYPRIRAALQRAEGARAAPRGRRRRASSSPT